MKKAKLPLYAGFCYRFSPCALKIRELVKKKAIGDVRSLRLIYNWDCHGKYELDGKGRKVNQKRREARMFEGGPVVDCGTHQIDLAMFWLNSEGYVLGALDKEPPLSAEMTQVLMQRSQYSGPEEKGEPKSQIPVQRESWQNEFDDPAVKSYTAPKRPLEQ
jgi:predicted dehydrogenase